jgi:hypothetical protein
MPSKDLTFVLLGEDRSASSTMSRTAEIAEKSTARIGAGFQRLGGMVGGEFGDIIGRTGEGLSQVGEKSGKLAAGLTVGGAAITGVGIALQALGSKDKQAQDQLEQAVRQTGKSIGDYKEGFEKAIKTQENFGHSAVDTQEALRKMTQATNDPKKALEQMGLVANLAAARHITLSDAADLVDKIMSGKGTRTLTEYGITMARAGNSAGALTAAHAGVQKSTATLEAAQLKLTQVEEAQHAKKVLTVADHIALENAQNRVTLAAAGLTKAHEKVTAAQDMQKSATNRTQDALDQLSKKVDGQANASVNNFGAQVNIAKTKLEDWGAAMGQKVGPVLTALGPILSIVCVGMELMRARQLAAAAATVVGTGATGAATVAQTGFNLSMLANPITLVIVAIVALVAGLVWFFTQTKLGQEIWKNFTKFLGDAWSFLWNSVLKPVFEAIGAIFTWLWNNIMKPYIALIVNEVKVFGAIFNWLWNNIISPVANWIGGAIRNVGAVIGAVFGGIAGVVSGSFSSVHGIIRGVMNGVVNLINGAIGGLNTLIRAVNSIPGVSIPTIGRLPAFADGGTMGTTGLALVGERGPEIVKLPGGARVYPNGTGPGASGGAAGNVVNVYITAAAVGNEDYLAKTVYTALQNAGRRGQISRQAFPGLA